MEVEVRAIFISPGHDFFGRHEKGRLDHGIVSLESVECVAGKGLRGDRFFDYKEDYKGQVTFFDWAVCEGIREQFALPDLNPSVFRRNVLVRGLDLNALIGERFVLQGIEFEGSEEAKPCYWMNDAVAPGAEEALRGRGGLRARILSDGILRKTWRR